MNILIVDDNANNRMILKLLLEDYEEDNDVKFSIDEACDGVEAVQKCEDASFDIVLMDIMMPNMDGIDATKIIRQKDSKIMIIAVSAVDDSDRKKQILNSGAEDYVAKPVKSDIFISRIENYITLIESRKHKKKSRTYLNLFSNKIYSRHTCFIATSDDALAEFWEFFLLNARAKYDNLSDVVRAIFSIAEAQIKLSIDSEIYIEESDNFQYFTLINIDNVARKTIELILKKNAVTCEYKMDDNKISFKLSKTYSEEIISEELSTVVPEIEEISSQVEFDISSKELEVFDYLDPDDMFDLEEFAGKLSSLMLVVGSGEVSQEEIVEIYSYLERIGSILATYSEVYPISKALTELSVDMSEHIEIFMENSQALGPMCKAFSNDMSNWITQSFYTGAPSIDFMNDTIVVNCQTIGSMLKIDEAPVNDEDFDDIFDF